MRSPITTHVLDLALGKPAAGLSVRLEQLDADAPETLATATTDEDGRVADLLPDPEEQRFAPGNYCLHFDTAGYFAATGRTSFYPSVTVSFTVSNPAEHHHVPLLLSPFGYSTYRGS